jgi:heme oxygenase
MTFSTTQVLAAKGHGCHQFAAVPEPIVLSRRLREETVALHKTVERAARLPDCVTTLDDYTACLLRFLALFAPLEAELAAWDQWESIGIDLQTRCRAPALLADLQQLGHAPPALAATPAFPNFAAAIGCLYVLEGSTLGGKFLLNNFTQTLGPSINGATAFFAGHGAAAGTAWNTFRAAIDAYGAAHPAEQDDVLAGAAATFRLFAAGLPAPITRPA